MKATSYYDENCFCLFANKDELSNGHSVDCVRCTCLMRIEQVKVDFSVL